MKRQLALLAFTLLLTAGSATPVPGEETSALDFTATALDGTTFSGQSLAGKAVLLDFWGSWCAPCIHAFPTLVRLDHDFGERLEVVGLAFYSGDLAEIAAFAAQHELSYTVLEGSDATIEKFEIVAFPTYVLISADGEVLFAQAGQVTDLYERVAAALGQPAGGLHAATTAAANLP